MAYFDRSFRWRCRIKHASRSVCNRPRLLVTHRPQISKLNWNRCSLTAPTCRPTFLGPISTPITTDAISDRHRRVASPIRSNGCSAWRDSCGAAANPRKRRFVGGKSSDHRRVLKRLNETQIGSRWLRQYRGDYGASGSIYRAVRDRSRRLTAVYRCWRQMLSQTMIQGTSVHDARLVALMEVNGITRILTLNISDFRRYAQVTVLTPSDVLSGNGL